MRTNVPNVLPPVTNHEGVRARHTTPYVELRRMTLAALLFEDTFYEGGGVQAAKVAELVTRCQPEDVAALAIECRDRMYLRHMPLFLIRELARVKGNGAIVAAALERVIQRPDELGEYLALYWKLPTDSKATGAKTPMLPKRQPLSAGSKRGLARAFKKFNAETLAKYDRDNAVKLRDVMRLVHARPENFLDAADAKSFVWKTTPPQTHKVKRHAEGQGAVWQQLINRTLESPDTWEVALSAGADKKTTFERLLREQKLGGLAFLRNLRNMVGANVDTALMRARFTGPFKKVLPFRFLAALKHAPSMATELNDAMLRAAVDLPKLDGTTIVLIDVSPSMHAQVSAKSDITREDAAIGVAILAREICEHVRVFSFSTDVGEVPTFRGLALVQPIKRAVESNGTLLGKAITAMNALPHDRLIVITDEESQDPVPAPKAKGYMINVATYGKSVTFGPWNHVDGWSERVLDFVRELEADDVVAP